jgi:hypothetical protein
MLIVDKYEELGTVTQWFSKKLNVPLGRDLKLKSMNRRSLIGISIHPEPGTSLFHQRWKRAGT